MATDALYLDEPLLEDALKTPYFFNGRLLTREDLTQEQTAQHAKRSHLGRGLGAGVAYGLEVVHNAEASNGRDIVLDVAPGLAITPDGDTLHVSDLVRLHFSGRPGSSAAPTTSAGQFGECPSGISVVSASAVSSGLHLLVLRCAAGKQGLAAVSGLGNEAAPCNTKYRTAGVGFRAFGLGTKLTRSDPLFRSRFALECFGFFDATLADALLDPLKVPSALEAPVRPLGDGAPVPGYGTIDTLRASGELTRCEVPLAIVHLRDNGELDFVDQWPVRRSLVRPPFSRRFWALGSSDDRRRAEGEAAMLCFQDHVEAVLGGGGLASVSANSRFAFLPGGGFLPVGDGRFDPATFFGANATPVVDADVGRLRTLIEESWRCDAIDLSAASRPAISYFVFAQAEGRWVFFLRRRTEVRILTSEPTEASPPATPSGGDGPVGVRSATKGDLLVIVTPTWLRAHGDPSVWVSDGREPRRAPEIDPDEAKAVLKKLSGQPPDRRIRSAFGSGVSGERQRIAFAGSRFFMLSGLRSGRYDVMVEGGDTRLAAREKLISAHVDPDAIAPVLVQ